MYRPQYDLPPINPAAFGGLPQGPQGGPPQPQGGPQGQPPMDMNKYLIEKVMEIKRRMGGGEPGALGAITEAMMSNSRLNRSRGWKCQCHNRVRNAFADCLNLWVTTPPYCDFPSKTIGWRLVPIFGGLGRY
jgi:hypothetical protein